MPVLEPEWIASLPEDNIEAWLHVCTAFREFEKAAPTPNTRRSYDEYLEWIALVISLLEVRPASVSLAPPSYNIGNDVQRLQQVLNTIETNAKASLEDRRKRALFLKAREFYPTILPGSFAYEFLDSDYKRVQELINEMRTLLTESTAILADHKRRMLSRLEKLQQEFSKKMSSLDVFWGLLGEAGMALGKFGKDVKPLTDRVCEVLKIVTRTQARANGLPAPEDSRLLRAVNQIAEP